MTRDAKGLLERALALPERERADLVASLLDSLEGPLEEGHETAWAEEIKRRLDELDSRIVTPVPFSEARRMIFGDDDPEAS
ncbi:MAG: addiction module protein [Planctomycetes bacterium]|nr:addiction module protein [Planctomycetota bacterium]